MVGVKTQIITEAIVTDRNTHDLTQFIELVGSSAKRNLLRSQTHTLNESHKQCYKLSARIGVAENAMGKGWADSCIRDIEEIQKHL